jgi:hypothetical protein
MRMKKESRCRIWIAPFQSKLFFRVIAYWLIYQISMWNFLFVWRLLRDGRGDLWEQYTGFCSEFYPILIAFSVIVPFFAYDAVRFSHRVAGPIYRFQQTIRAIAAGKPVPVVKLRKGDYLIDFQNDLNAMIFTLQRQSAIAMEIKTQALSEGVTAEPEPILVQEEAS